MDLLNFIKCNVNNFIFPACYIEIDDDVFNRGNEEDVQWANLPDLLLEQIFSYLSISERLLRFYLFIF